MHALDQTWRLLSECLPLAAGEPTMDAAMITRIVSRALHLLSAIILGGGVFYIRSVLAETGPDAYFGGRRQVWARWIAVTSTVLIATGLFNYIMFVRDAKVPGATALPPTYHMLFGVKFLLAIGVMGVASIVAGKTAAAERARASMPRWLNMAWTGIMAIVVIGALMRFFH